MTENLLKIKSEVVDLVEHIETKGRLVDKNKVKRAYEIYNHIYHLNHQRYNVPKRSYLEYGKRSCSSCTKTVVANLRGFAGYPKRYFVTRKEYQERAAICKGCKYYKPLTGTCGTFGMPRKNKEGKTCGCIIKIKAYLEDQSCPLNKPKW